MDGFCEVTGKRKFRGESEARNAIPKRTGARLRTYLCEHCRYYHYTKEKFRVRERRKVASW